MKADLPQEPFVQPPSSRVRQPVAPIVPITDETTRAIERPVTVRQKSPEPETKQSESKVVPIPPKDAVNHRSQPVPLPPIVPSVRRSPREPEAQLKIAAKKNDAESKAPSPPRIEITIGTVEVRAMVAPSAPVPVQRAPQREPAPAVSLTDYLRQRGNSRA
jgi:hypothetical protein